MRGSSGERHILSEKTELLVGKLARSSACAPLSEAAEGTWMKAVLSQAGEPQLWEPERKGGSQEMVDAPWTPTKRPGVLMLLGEGLAIIQKGADENATHVGRDLCVCN